MTAPVPPPLVKARRFLRSAEVLRDDGDFDSAASRLYYAMFHAAEAVLAAKGLKFKTHRAVLAGYGRHAVQSGDMPEETHRWFLDAYDLRHLGDYTPLAAVQESQIEVFVRRAAAFVEEAERWLSRQA